MRKTLGYSKKLTMLEASSMWEDAIYKSWASAQELEDRDLGRGRRTLEEEISRDGGGIDGSHLED